MKKSIRLNLLIIFTLFVCLATLCLGIGISNVMPAKADAHAVFELCEGASVKNGTNREDTGMRFKVRVTRGVTLDGNIRFVIAPVNYYKRHDFSAGNLFGKNAKYYFSDTDKVGTLKDGKVNIWNVKAEYSDYDDHYDYYSASIIDFGGVDFGYATETDYAKALVREYIAGAYIDDGSELPVMATYEGGDALKHARSMAFVADKALDNNEAVMSEFESVYLPKAVQNYEFKVTYTYNYGGELLTKPKTETIVDYLAATYTYAEGAKLNMESYKEEEEYIWKAAWSDIDGTYYVSDVKNGNIGNQTLELVFHPKTIPSATVDTYEGTFNGKTYDNTFKIPYKGISDITIFNDDGAGITCNDAKDTITVSKAGSTMVIMCFRGVSETRNAYYKINAERPILAVAEEIKLFDATKGKYITVDGDAVAEKDIQTLLSSKSDTPVELVNTTITAKSVEETPSTTSVGVITYANGALTGVPVNGTKMVKQVVSFETDTATYQVTVCPSTKVLSTMDDIKGTFQNNSTENTVEGYYTLAKDINNSSLVDVGGNNKNTFTGVFDGNGKTIDQIKAGINGIFGDINNGTIKNVAFTNVKIENAKNAGCTLLGRLQNTSCLENVYIKMAGIAYPNNDTRIVSVLSRTDIPNTVKMMNVVVDSSDYQIQEGSKTAGFTDRTFSHYSPYGGFTNTKNSTYWTTSDESYTPDEDAITTLEKNQKNVYFITRDYLYQYKEDNNTNVSTDVRILDAGNKRGEEFVSANVGGIDGSTAVIAYVDTFFRYDTAEDMKVATSSGDFTAFTSTGLWSQDSEKGLVWKGSN